jgi:hypothetical protein
MLLCARGLSRTNPKKPRAGIFLPDDPLWRRPWMQKFPMPFATSLGNQFFRIFAEAYLLTGRKKIMVPFSFFKKYDLLRF